jgi:hypothetical protein
MHERVLVLTEVANMHGGVETRTWQERVTTVLLAGLVTALMLLATTGTAHATCYSSTPSTQTFADSTGDTTGDDILHVDVTLEAGCGITIDPVLSAGLTASDSVSTYINTDGNTATGDTFFGGADKAVVVSGLFPGVPPVLAICTTHPCELSGGKFLTPVGVAGFSTNLDELGVGSPTTLGIVVVSFYAPPAPASPDADIAPNVPPAYAFATSFTTSPPAPPGPPPPPSPPASPPAPPAAQTQKVSKGCTVPKLKGKSVAKAKKALAKAGCKYKIKGKGKVVSTKPKAGTQTSGAVQVKAKKKRKRH